MSPATATPGTTTRQRVGLVLCVLYCLANVPSAVLPSGSGDEVGPPTEILVADSVLGLIGVVAGVLAWRGGATPLRVAAVAMVLLNLTAMPALFVGVPAAVKVAVAFFVVLTVVSVVLMFSGRRAAPSGA